MFQLKFVFAHNYQEYYAKTRNIKYFFLTEGRRVMIIIIRISISMKTNLVPCEFLWKSVFLVIFHPILSGYRQIQ